MTGGPQTRRAEARKQTARFRPELNMLERRELLSFAAPVAYYAGYEPQALVTADVNGKPDLVSLSGYGEDTTVLSNNGNGTFGSYVNYPDGGNGGLVMTALASYEIDGAPVTATAGYVSGQVWEGTRGPFSFMEGDGKTDFGSPQIDYILPDNQTITSLALAENVDGNGYLDFVAGDTSGGVYVGGVFNNAWVVQALELPATVAAYPVTTSAAVANLNGDGSPDIVVTRSAVDMSGDSVYVFLNNGNGTFGAPETYTVGGAPTSVAVGNLVPNSSPDIVTANSNSTMSVLLNNGNGTFGAAQNYAIGGPGNSVAVGDFNHDGNLDVATAGAELDVLMNNGTGTFGAYQKVGPAGSSVVAADFNGDGFADLAQVETSQNSVDVFLAGSPANPVSLSFGAITYIKNKKVYSETVTLTNTTSSSLMGPLSLELTGLPSGVVLTDATGTTNGNPFIRFLGSGNTLKKGASVTITLTFTAASQSAITFGTEVVNL
jgi:hypothetical protein